MEFIYLFFFFPFLFVSRFESRIFQLFSTDSYIYIYTDDVTFTFSCI